MDNSHLCFECTGAGCKVCNGTGIDPDFKPTKNKMTIENFERAAELKEQATYIVEKIKKLRVLNDNAEHIEYASLGTPYVPSVGETFFNLGAGKGRGNQMDQQPERVQILCKAFAAVLLEAYEAELAKIEKEFNEL